MSHFQTQFFASFDDTDLGGVVFFGNYFRIAHRCLEQFIESRSIAWDHWFQNPDFLVPLVHSEADYKRPLFAGKTYSNQIKIENISDSSVTFAYRFLDEKGQECASLKTVHVFVDKSSYQKMAIPESIRKSLA